MRTLSMPARTNRRSAVSTLLPLSGLRFLGLRPTNMVCSPYRCFLKKRSLITIVCAGNDLPLWYAHYGTTLFVTQNEFYTFNFL